MNNKDMELFKEIKDRCRLSFELRGKMSLIQEKKYLAYKSNFTLEDIEILISDWIRSKQEFSKVKKPIKVEMKNLLLDKQQMERYVYNKKHELFNLLGEIDSFNYLYVTHRDDGMVVTVGKSSVTNYSIGDMFFQLNTNSLSGTENIILRNRYGNEIFKEYDLFLKHYLNIAWIVPVESGVVKKLERSLGDKLIDEGVPILNYYSHRQ